MAYSRSRAPRRAASRTRTTRRTGRSYARPATRRAPARRRAAPARARRAAPRTIRIVVETQAMNGVQRPDLGLKAPPKPRQPAFK